MSADLKPGILASAVLAILLLAFAVSIDFPKANGGGFKGDEATYYVLGHSLARDFDFTFERKDLRRVWEEFPGPQGIFLKRGKAIDIQGSSRFPFLRWIKLDDPQRDTRLYFSKSYIYPLVAAPFIFLFGTSGFLVLHAWLLSLDFLVVYLFLHARTKSNRAALPLAAVFLFASLVPVYFVWLTPELFNFSLVLYALFFWSYGEVGGKSSAKADYLAAALLGVLIFSKPTHAPLLFPLAVLAASRRQWKRALTTVVICGAGVAALFAANAAITGEFNYQGGDRKTFYADRGFPFANTWETFDNIGPVRGREDIMVGDVLANTHSFTVFRHNLVYFVMGRNAGLVPYFFPGVLAALLFIASKQRQRWQWLVMATVLGAVVMHVLLWPFTWNGGGGPVGSRYFLSFYPLFLFLTPAGAGLGAALTGLSAGALFTAQIVLNPFYSSINPGEHAKSGPLGLLPIELTLINDLPVAQNIERMKRPLGGAPPVLAYFPDDNVFNTEAVPPVSTQCPADCWFWVKGKRKADVVLRAPVPRVSPDKDEYVSKIITRLNIDVQNSGVANRVTVSTGRDSQTLDMSPGELRRITLAVRSGVPYRRDVQPTSYLYTMSVKTTNGFVPFLDDPCDKPCGPRDNRYLGAMIHVVPEYTDADITTWMAPPDTLGPEETRAVGYATHLESRVARKVTKAIHDFNLIEDGDRVMVGLSGGKDSWALMQILDVLRRRAPITFSLVAVNVDSGYEAFQHGAIKSACDARGWECLVQHTSIGEVMDDLLAANATPCSLCARLRRGVLYRIADEIGATKIALGHHADDFIETLLLNLFFEGSLKAMPARLVSDKGAHVVIRPLVYISENDCRDYAKSMELPIIGCCCPVCGDLSLQRQRIKQLLMDLERDNVGVKQSMLKALSNVSPRYLLDPRLNPAVEILGDREGGALGPLLQIRVPS